jgi:hypothetical protein
MSPGLISRPRLADLNGCASDQAEDQVDVSDSPTTHWSALIDAATSRSIPGLGSGVRELRQSLDEDRHLPRVAVE